MKAAFEQARLALKFLETHQLDPSPSHYEFALAVIAEPGGLLARAVWERTDGGLRLTASAVQMLRAGDFPSASAPLSSATAHARAREQTVARQAEELGSLASDAQQLTETLGRDVGTMVDRATNWPGQASTFVTRLSLAERELADLRTEITILRQTLHRPEQAGHGTSDEAARFTRGSAFPREEQLSFENERDDLTHALSRSGARDLMQRVAQGGRSQVIMMFRVDELEAINERYGRAVGDNVLNAFAATLQHTFDSEELIRWSGNEFLFIARDLEMDRAERRTEEALAAFAARRLRLRGSGELIGTVTGSAGIASGQSGEQERIIAHAGLLARRATAAGGNRYET